MTSLQTVQDTVAPTIKQGVEEVAVVATTSSISTLAVIVILSTLVIVGIVLVNIAKGRKKAAAITAALEAEDALMKAEKEEVIEAGEDSVKEIKVEAEVVAQKNTIAPAPRRPKKKAIAKK